MDQDEKLISSLVGLYATTGKVEAYLKKQEEKKNTFRMVKDFFQRILKASLLIVVVTGYCEAQQQESLPYNTKNVREIQNLFSELNTYKISKIDSGYYQYKPIYFEFVNADSTQKIYAHIDRRIEPDKSVLLSFKQFVGPFDDLFPLWQKYGDHDADKEAIRKQVLKQHAVILKFGDVQRRLVFFQSNKREWVLVIRPA